MPRPGLLGGAKTQTTPETRRLIVQSFHRANPALTSADIARLFSEHHEGEVSPSFVRRWWEEDRYERKPGSGGHNRLPPSRAATVVGLCKGFRKNRDGSHRRAFSQRRASSEMNRRGTPISMTSVRRSLSAAGLRYKTRGKASRLSVRNREGRRRLYDLEAGRTKEGWRPVVFTDSTPVALQYGGNTRNDGSYVLPGEEVPPQTKNKHSKFAHCYGAVCGYKIWGPYWVEEGQSITGERYVDQVLRPMVRDIMEWGEENKVDLEFQQDGAGAHFAACTQRYLEAVGVNFWPKGKWPGNSADLSPIENVWAVLKATIYEFGEPKTLMELKRMVANFFKNFGEAACRKLSDGMPRRFELLRERAYFAIGK